jgi:hypothetical protein
MYSNNNFPHARTNNVPPIKRVVEKLAARPSGSNGWYAAHCPAHGDTHASLSFRETDEGRVVFKCHALDCSREAIIEAMGLTERELSPRGYRPAASSLVHRATFDLVTLAHEKLLPWQFLFNLGLADDYPYQGHKVVRIPYKTLDGEIHPKVRIRRGPRGKDSLWDQHTPGEIIPYGLDRLQEAREQGYLLIGEGESDAWTCWFYHLPFLGIPGATMTRCLNGELLKDIPRIYILQEPDKAGHEFYRLLHRQLRQISYTGAIFALPCQQLLNHKDPSELHKYLIRQGQGACERFKELVLAALEQAIPSGDEKDAANTFGCANSSINGDVENVEMGQKLSQADALIQMAQQHLSYFSTSNDEYYALVPVKGHREAHRLSEHSSFFKHWLIQHYREETGLVPGEKAITMALNALTAEARFATVETKDVFLRVGHKDGNIYLDLGNKQHEVVEITPEGWQVIPEAPVCFRRPKGMKALPTPERGGTLSLLDSLINADEENLLLMKAWLVGCLHPKGPYAILGVHGGQGAAKSTSTEVLHMLLDPAKPSICPNPADERTLAVAAHNNHILAYDNLSKIDFWLSDAFCRIATGAGDAYRQMYTDDEEAIFQFCRPIVFNSIEEIATRGDLLDRCILVDLLNISKQDRMTEGAFDKLFNDFHAPLLGALLDAASMALRNLPNVQLEELPRMADFAQWIVACEPLLTNHPGHFMEIYGENRAEAVAIEIESSSLATTICQFIEQQPYEQWTGYMDELLKKLNTIASEDDKRIHSWPKTAKGLSGKLKRLTTGLRAVNVNIEVKERDRHGRPVLIRATPDKKSV